ncbi:MAG: 30S ribosomal protein S17 [Planctomycetota bacterium]
MATHERRTVRGLVVSDSMDKTIVVRSERLVKHPRYKKYMRKFTKYYAHDESNQAHKGDTVEISETRPLSKKKRWRLLEVVTVAPGSGGTA